MVRDEVMLPEATVAQVPAEHIFTNSASVLDLDLYRCQGEDLDVTEVPFSLVATRAGTLASFVVWFDTSFGATRDAAAADKTVLSTAPDAPPTHWKQASLWLPREEQPVLRQGESVVGTYTFVRAEDDQSRDYSVAVEWLNEETGKRTRRAWTFS
jgi:hypothetical protein